MPLEHDTDTALALAVRKAGSQSAFARLIGKRQSTVNDWLRLNKELPAELVLAVEEKLGVDRHALRPDIYPLDHALAPLCDASDKQAIRNPLEQQINERGARETAEI